MALCECLEAGWRSPETAIDEHTGHHNHPVTGGRVEIEDASVPGGPAGDVSIRIMHPKGAGGLRFAILCTYGAGCVSGNSHTYDRRIREHTDGTGNALVFTNYSLPPEARSAARRTQRHPLGGIHLISSTSPTTSSGKSRHARSAVSTGRANRRPRARQARSPRETSLSRVAGRSSLVTRASSAVNGSIARTSGRTSDPRSPPRSDSFDRTSAMFTVEIVAPLRMASSTTSAPGSSKRKASSADASSTVTCSLVSSRP